MRPEIFRVFFCLLTLIFCLAMHASPAHAARFSGNYLLAVCGSDESGKELVPGGHATCQSYIAGVIDYQNMMRSMGAGPALDFCLPSNITLNQIQNVVLRYLIRNKNQHGSFVAAPAVAMALFKQFPCGQKRSRR